MPPPTLNSEEPDIWFFTARPTEAFNELTNAARWHRQERSIT